MKTPLTALFHGSMDPVFPCRIMCTRHCPARYEAVCGERPCARYESEDYWPWLAEVAETCELIQLRKGLGQ